MFNYEVILHVSYKIYPCSNFCAFAIWLQLTAYYDVSKTVNPQSVSVSRTFISFSTPSLLYNINIVCNVCVCVQTVDTILDHV